MNIILLIVLTLLSGIGDAQGFLHSGLVWKNGQIVIGEAMKSMASFIVGIVLYWQAIKVLNEIKIVPVETQTLAWFGTTIICLAMFNGSFFRWSISLQIVAILVCIGIGWILFHTGG